MNETLLQLALAAGIEARYWDGLGVQRDLHENTARALLEANGFDVSGDPAAQLQRLAGEHLARALPPAQVITADELVELSIVLPSDRRSEPLDWELIEEGGNCHSGSIVPAQLDKFDEGERDGKGCTRYRLRLAQALPAGYHRFRLPALDAETLLIATPRRCFIPPPLAEGARCWGFAVQLYALRSARNWGIGDFSDLAALATAAGKAGAAFIGLNPLHARHLVQPDEASPYAPSSRLFLDPIYIDVGAVEGLQDCAEAQALIAGAEFQAQLAAARATKLVDYTGVTALKLPVLERLFARFRQQAGKASAAFAAFKQQSGEALRKFSEFEALRLHLRERHGRSLNWREWPLEYHDPDGAALASFRAEAAVQIDFQCYLQWLAAMQLQRAAEAARAAGMAIGLYRDVAVGAAHDSAETWSDQSLFAHDVSVGAPPDMLNRQGQSWGLPPWKPRALAENAFAVFRRLLAANMRDAGALRIDHVMALTRLFWIPLGMSGADGGYVKNAFDVLVAIVALESARNRCMVIGEDLGSVPDGLRAQLRDAGLLSYRVLVYERHWQGDGSFCHPHEYPPQSLATVATHDMPTMAEFWRGDDITRRDGLGLFPDAQQCDDEKARRDGERAGLLRLLAETGLSPADTSNAGDVIEALHGAVARTRSMLAVVQLDDLLGETEPVNIPGTYREYPNWQRKLSLPVEEIVGDARWERLAAVMRAAGRACPG